MIFILKRFLINFINTTMKRLSFRDKLKLFEKKIETNTGENITPKKKISSKLFKIFRNTFSLV